MSNFAKRLRELRKEKGLTGEELGKKFSVTKTAVSYWENDKTFPDELTIKKLADFFECTTDYLLGRTDIKNPYKEEEYEIQTIAAHHDGEEWTEEELEELEMFKELVRKRREKKKTK